MRAEVLAALLTGSLEVGPGQVGAVYLDRARITGKLELPGATLKHRLRLNSCHVADGFDLSEATSPTLSLYRCYVGAIRLYGTKINGSFDLEGAHLDGKGESAMYAAGLTVTASMYCSDGFQANGQINLEDASIGGLLAFRGANLNGSEGRALYADRLTVAASMYCNQGFQANGEISLAGASIGGQLTFRGANLNGRGGRALSAVALTVTADMLITDGFQANGEVELAHAKIGRLVDEKESWPQFLRLDGLTYGDLTYMPARERRAWLNRTAGYSPQPYEELARYYRRLGHDEQARHVLLAKQRRGRRQRPWWTRWWGWLQDVLAGYGYAPGRALLLLASAFVAGWLVFRARQPVPVGAGPHPAFNAALYTLDVLVPAPALGQASDFDPQGATLAVAGGLHILGWLLAITVIAAVTRSFSRT